MVECSTSSSLAIPTLSEPLLLINHHSSFTLFKLLSEPLLTLRRKGILTVILILYKNSACLIFKKKLKISPFKYRHTGKKIRMRARTAILAELMGHMSQTQCDDCDQNSTRKQPWVSSHIQPGPDSTDNQSLWLHFSGAAVRAFTLDSSSKSFIETLHQRRLTGT